MLILLLVRRHNSRITILFRAFFQSYNLRSYCDEWTKFAKKIGISKQLKCNVFKSASILSSSLPLMAYLAFFCNSLCFVRYLCHVIHWKCFISNFPLSVRLLNAPFSYPPVTVHTLFCVFRTVLVLEHCSTLFTHTGLKMESHNSSI